MNNAVYLDWLEEALSAAGLPPEDLGLPRHYRLEYLASAELGDAIAVDVTGEPSGWFARIRRADGVELVRAEGGPAR